MRVFKVVEVDVQMTVCTSCKPKGGPFLSLIVTGPVAFDQVKVNGSPAVTLLRTTFVNWTACARPVNATAAKRRVENCILMVLVEELKLDGKARISLLNSSFGANATRTRV